MFKQSVLLIYLACLPLIHAMGYDDKKPLVTITAIEQRGSPEKTLSSQNFEMLGLILWDIGKTYKGEFPAELSEADATFNLTEPQKTDKANPEEPTKVPGKKILQQLHKNPQKAKFGKRDERLKPLFLITDDGRVLVNDPLDLSQIFIECARSFESSWIFLRDSYFSIGTVLANQAKTSFYLLAFKKAYEQREHSLRIMHLERNGNEITAVAHAEPTQLHGLNNSSWWDLFQYKILVGQKAGTLKFYRNGYGISNNTSGVGFWVKDKEKE